MSVFYVKCNLKVCCFFEAIVVDGVYDDDPFDDFNLMNWWWLVELWLIDCMDV